MVKLQSPRVPIKNEHTDDQRIACTKQVLTLYRPPLLLAQWRPLSHDGGTLNARLVPQRANRKLLQTSRATVLCERGCVAWGSPFGEGWLCTVGALRVWCPCVQGCARGTRAIPCGVTWECSARKGDRHGVAWLVRSSRQRTVVGRHCLPSGDSWEARNGPPWRCERQSVWVRMLLLMRGM